MRDSCDQRRAAVVQPVEPDPSRRVSSFHGGQFRIRRGTLRILVAVDTVRVRSGEKLCERRRPDRACELLLNTSGAKKQAPSQVPVARSSFFSSCRETIPSTQGTPSGGRG